PRDLEADRLIGADGLAERLALLGVLDAFVDAALRGTGGQRGDGDAALVQDGQEVRVTVPASAQQVLLRDPGVGEGQRVCVRSVPADLAVDRLDGETRCAAGHNDRRDLFFVVRASAGDRGDGDQ